MRGRGTSSDVVCRITSSPAARRCRRRMSKDFTQNLVGLCIEAVSVTQQYTLGLPRVNFADRRFRPSPLKKKRQSHAKEDLTVRMIHAGKLRRRPPRLPDLIQFEVDDSVGEYQRLRNSVKKDELPEIAAGEQRLVQFFTPFFRRSGVEVLRENDVYMSRTRPLPDTWRRPSDGIGKSLRPFRDMRVVKLIGRHEMTNSPQSLQFVGQALIKFDRRMQEEISVREPHNGHSRCEGHRQLYSGYGQILDRPIDDADVRTDRFVDVNGLVERGGHIAVQTLGFAIEPETLSGRNGQLRPYSNGPLSKDVSNVEGVALSRHCQPKSNGLSPPAEPRPPVRLPLAADPCCSVLRRSMARPDSNVRNVAILFVFR